MPIPTTAPRDRLTAAFRRAGAAGRAALVGCLPAGCPTAEDSVTALRTLSWHADVLVIGTPLGDPVTPGPAAPPVTPAAVLEILREVSATAGVPVVLTAGRELLLRSGPGALAAAVASAGAAGVVLPDLHPAGPEAGRWLAAAVRHRLATTFLADHDRFPDAAVTSTGWVHLPANTDPAGAAGVLDLTDLRHRTGQARRLTTAPVCTGIGITSPELAAAAAPGVDGVAVGSAFVQVLKDAPERAAAISELDHRAARYAAALRAVPGGRRRECRREANGCDRWLARHAPRDRPTSERGCR
ncbi:tryptophan synthase subunit alpha [Streptomyces sp. TRM 70361]|uniref:tryptophan synthase subunit alpha n=1 Tax=Streptomyces sp. TRM 70361 TaxID=3116553 RepID=UPI002E7BA64A|nr:tryptophan synthase subunit alpha [Streptomyces sp. TRM 70361]MEE1938089.1 tryptophan synthase subunit alpha [Streptomyces sp. TRM 70361]